MQNETLTGAKKKKKNLSFLAGAAHLSKVQDNQQGDQQLCKLVIRIIVCVISVKIIKTCGRKPHSQVLITKAEQRSGKSVSLQHLC